MSSGPSTPGPRHLAPGANRRPGPRPRPAAADPRYSAHHLSHAPRRRPAPAPPLELLEVTPPVRAKRSRVAFALAVSVAALPVLVVDNLPASAEPEAVKSVAIEESSTTTAAPSTTSTTAAPTTTTTAAPATTEAPPTTEAEVHTLAAAAPAPTAPPTTVAPTTTRPPAPSSSGPDPSDPATWDELAQCESGGNWAADTGNGYYGGLQFSLETWRDVGGSGYPHESSRAEQIKRGQILQGRYGWGQWPHCANELGWT